MDIQLYRKVVISYYDRGYKIVWRMRSAYNTTFNRAQTILVRF